MFGTGELIVIVCLILLLFGGKKLPELARNIGKGAREFRRALDFDSEPLDEKKSTQEDIVKKNDEFKDN